jgi:hypothetical protein
LKFACKVKTNEKENIIVVLQYTQRGIRRGLKQRDKKTNAISSKRDQKRVETERQTNIIVQYSQ